MKWLEPPRDDAERLLRSGLDQLARPDGDDMAQRRVWTAIETLPLTEVRLRPRRWMAPALTGALLACGVAAVILALPLTRTREAPRPSASVVPASTPAKPAAEPMRAESQQVRVALAEGTDVELDPNSVLGWDAERRPKLSRGRARFRVATQKPGQNFAVVAGPYVISVLGTRFHVKVTDDRVGVDVEEGVVEIRRGPRIVRLVAGDSWTGPVAEPAARKPALPTAQQLQARSELREAQSALAAGEPARAVAILRKLSLGKDATAENATYQLGRVLRDDMRRPREAVAAWHRYRSRFPAGLLRVEAELSLVETLASLGDRARALAEAEAFLSRYPASERRAEVERLATRLRGAGGP